MEGADDVEAILDAVENESLGLFAWLERRPDAKARFWEFVERGHFDRGLPFSAVVNRWRVEFPDAPPQEPGNTKIWVKRERAKRT